MLVPLNSKKQYCSKKCFKLYKQKQKISKLESKECKINDCKNIFTTFKKGTKGKSPKLFCSKQCQNKVQSNGLIKTRVRSFAGYRDDLKDYFRSSFEANFARYLNYIGIKYEHENKTFYIENRKNGILRIFSI